MTSQNSASPVDAIMTKLAFDDALDAYVAMVQAKATAHDATFTPGLFNTKIVVEAGRIYVRVWKEDGRGTSRSVHSFVRIEDGAILYPAGWKKPFIAKGGRMCAATVRGSIYAADSGASSVNHYGVVNVR